METFLAIAFLVVMGSLLVVLIVVGSIIDTIDNP